MDAKPTMESLVASGRSLEDSFFLEQDRQLLASRAQLAKLAETKEALASVSGIRNDEVLQHLVEMNVRPETLAALSTVPLLEVVWADGKVDEKEKNVVLEFAAAQGITKDSVAYGLLQRWLEHRPTEALMKAWQLHVQTICQQLPEHERSPFKDELLRNVRAAAQASGGLLGVGSISSAERAVIEMLESTFGCP